MVKVKRRLLPLVAALTAVALTCSVSAAKLATRHTYTLRLAKAEYITFAAGKEHAFEIPCDGYYAIRLWGGDGGDGRNEWWDGGGESYPYGGKGGAVEAVAHFTVGTSLLITVGTGGDVTTGGFNGGGSGGTFYTGGFFNNYYGGGGGGATDVRLGGATLDDRILVAGGGGGTSGSDSNYGPGAGGNGGANGGNYAGANGEGAGYGQGGGPAAGGAGNGDGSLGNGGGGAYSGGGGGGGYYGGGGAYGSAGGGGGGSAYISERFTRSVPEGMLGRESFEGDSRDGFAVITFLGSRYVQEQPSGGAWMIYYNVGVASDIPEEPTDDLSAFESLPEPIPEPAPMPLPELLPEELAPEFGAEAELAQESEEQLEEESEQDRPTEEIASEQTEPS